MTNAMTGIVSVALNPATTQILTNALMKSIPNPAYAHSFTLAGNFGTMSTIEPRTLNTVRSVTKYRGYPRPTMPWIDISLCEVRAGMTPSKINIRLVVTQKIILCFFIIGCFVYLFKYLPAMLMAKEGSMIKTVVCKSLASTSLSAVCSPSSPPVRTSTIPIIPKAIDAPINIFVAIFCII